MILIEAVTGMFTIGWSMLTAVKFPGSEIPIAVILVGAFVIWFAIRIFAFVMRMSIHVDEAPKKPDFSKNRVGQRWTDGRS